MKRKLYLEQEQLYTVDDLKKQIEDEFIEYLKTQTGETTFTVEYPFNTSPMDMQMNDQNYYVNNFDLDNDDFSEEFWDLLCEFVDIPSDIKSDVEREISENIDEYKHIVSCFDETVTTLLEDEYTSKSVEIIENEFGEDYIQYSDYLPYLDGYITLDVEEVYFQNDNEIVITLNREIDFDKLKSNIKEVIDDIIGSNYGLTDDELNNTTGFTEEEIKDISENIIYNDSDILEEIIDELDNMDRYGDNVVESILNNRREFDSIYPDFSSSEAKEQIQETYDFDDQIDEIKSQIEFIQSETE